MGFMGYYCTLKLSIIQGGGKQAQEHRGCIITASVLQLRCTIVPLKLHLWEPNMDVIIDTSVIIAVIANEPEKETLVELTTGADLIAPYSVHWEIGNAFSAMLKRERIKVEQAIQAIKLYQQIPLRFVDVELEEALKIAATLGIYAYDAYLIRCALKYKSPLISLDRNLVKAAREMKAKVIEVIK